MTLIAFRVQPERADIVTDTWNYLPNARELGHTSKVALLPHLDTAVLARGDSRFCDLWRGDAAILAQSDFDALVNDAPTVLRNLWRLRLEEVDGGYLTPSMAYLIGSSTEAGGFRAVGFSSYQDFKPFEFVYGFHMIPTPMGCRPDSAFERRQLEEGLAENTTKVQESLAIIKAWPFVVPPNTEEEWAELAHAARATRSQAPTRSGLKVLVGGDLMHTVLTRGEATIRRVLSFDDSGEEFRSIVAGTAHPLGQLGACPCGSGDRYLDCHLAERADDPCSCQSGRPFANCCSLNRGPATCLASPSEHAK